MNLLIFVVLGAVGLVCGATLLCYSILTQPSNEPSVNQQPRPVVSQRLCECVCPFVCVSVFVRLCFCATPLGS